MFWFWQIVSHFRIRYIVNVVAVSYEDGPSPKSSKDLFRGYHFPLLSSVSVILVHRKTVISEEDATYIDDFWRPAGYATLSGSLLQNEG